MAGYANQVKSYVRLVLMKGKPSVTKPKLNEVTGMENYTHRIPTPLETYENALIAANYNYIEWINKLQEGQPYDHTKLELVISKTGELAMDIVKVFNEYQVRGNIQACGSWDGKNDVLDPWYDVHIAIQKLPLGDKPFYLTMNNRTKNYLYCVDYDRKPFYETIIPLFCHVCPVAEEVRKVILEDLKDVILRTNNKIPDNMALLVSDNNNIIIIDC